MQVRSIQDLVMKEAQAPVGTQKWNIKYPWASGQVGKNKEKRTFCNYALNKELRLLGVPTEGVTKGLHRKWEPPMEQSLAAFLYPQPGGSSRTIRSWQSLRFADIGRGRTHTANEIFNKFNASAASTKGLWKDVPVNYVQQLVDNIGASVVAARHGAPDPSAKGGFKRGHVAVVRALPDLDFGQSFNPNAGPYLNNIGETAITKVIPAAMSHGGNFRYFFNRYDPQVVRAGKTAAIETDPSFQGIRHTASKHLFNVVAKARKETDTSFTGPRSASTSFLTDSLGWNPHAPASRDPLTASLTQINQNVIWHQRDVDLLRQATRHFGRP